MKNMKIISISFFIFITLYGCDRNEKKQITGTWVTEACEKAINFSHLPIQYSAILNLNTEYWAVGVYTFTKENEILYHPRLYTNSQCIETTPPLNLGTAISATFFESNEITLPEGLKGREITISFEQSKDIAFGHYTISDKLCFSKNLLFSALDFSFLNIENTNINFEKCLTISNN
ncbi:hypothetical protein MNBD_GAMMA10-379 [hydrothermal vent metagenome]|uniref:Lipoprotein n=1 Tax=hydrothermal vent metagenome TaxID=652676 RepID=A0A3B0XVI8_9ZZZZ